MCMFKKYLRCFSHGHIRERLTVSELSETLKVDLSHLFQKHFLIKPLMLGIPFRTGKS